MHTYTTMSLTYLQRSCLVSPNPPLGPVLATKFKQCGHNRLWLCAVLFFTLYVMRSFVLFDVGLTLTLVW